MALEKRKKTGKYCVVYGCRSTHVDELSLHCFPKDDRPYLRMQWIQFVKETRPDFQQPTVHSVLCERHFTSDCYPREYRLKRMLNIPILKKKLLPDAVPSIHPEVSSPASPPVISSPAPKKMRPVFSRGLMDITHNFSMENEISEMETDKENNEPDLPPVSVGIQVEQQRVRPRRKSKRVQTKVNGVDKAIQVDLRNKPVYRTVGTQCNLDLKEEQQNPTVCSTLGSSPLIDFTTHQNSPTVAIDKDSDYLPCSDEEFTDNDSDFSDAQFSERKFIVYESQLLQLFDYCPACSFPTLNSVKHVLGTMVQIQQECGSCGLNRLWNSQPMTGAIPDGNLLLSSAILFSGCIPSKALRLLNHMAVATITRNTFFNHQKYYLHPTVRQMWKSYQERYFQQMQEQGEPLILGGDGRADTPGHSAKFGSYSMLDLNLMVVVDIQLVQSNEVGNSARMEKEGLVRSLAKFKNNNLQIDEIVTDRHCQIVKHIRENLPNTTHHFDVWHVAKGLKKKLTSLGKEKECEIVNQWIKSVSNHMYWVAASTPDGNGDVMLEKWLSVSNHVMNVHRHDGVHFTECQHGTLEGRERKKKWLTAGTKAGEKFTDIINSKQMKRDVPKLSPGPQTAALEGYHSVVNHFAPKMVGFSYQGMLSRLILAALHYNENGMKEQAKTRNGNLRYSLVFPKYKKGGFTVRPLKNECTFEYVKVLLSQVRGMVLDNAMTLNPELERPPPPLCSTYVRPDKSVAIQQLKSRFSFTENQCNDHQDQDTFL